MFYQKILKNFRKKDFCPFCNSNSEFRIIENESAYITLARAPYVKNHLLVIPKRHILSLNNLTGNEKKEIFDLMLFGIKLLEKKYPAVQMQYKEGDLISAGKTIPHAHFHLVPKRKKTKEIKDKRKFLREGELIKKVNEVKNF